MRLRIRAVIPPAVLVVAAMAGYFATTAARAASDGITPAGEGEATYQLSDLRVSSLSESEVGASVAVSLDTSWSTESYPGSAMCKVEVMELSGASIGEIQFELETLEPTSSLELTVPVGGVPKTVEGFCAEAARPQGSYEFDELSLHQAVDDWTGEQSLELIARALWSGDASPGTAFCRATAELRDGAQIHEDFTLAVPNGTKVTVHVPAAFRDALDISIACGATAKEGWR